MSVLIALQIMVTWTTHPHSHAQKLTETPTHNSKQTKEAIAFVIWLQLL